MKIEGLLAPGGVLGLNCHSFSPFHSFLPFTKLATIRWKWQHLKIIKQMQDLNYKSVSMYLPWYLLGCAIKDL